jgi:hypothetical protein
MPDTAKITPGVGKRARKAFDPFEYAGSGTSSTPEAKITPVSFP